MVGLAPHHGVHGRQPRFAGGSGAGHYRWLDPDKSENVTIPWICVAPGVPAGLKIERVIRTYDTAPTALSLIGLGAPEGIDGRPVEEVLR